jgi:hypothetical protein
MVTMQWWRLRPDDAAWAGLSVVSMLAWLRTVASRTASVEAPCPSLLPDDEGASQGSVWQK